MSASARRLGVRFGDGLSVDVVTPGSAGDTAGIQMGDKIVKAGDKDVTTVAELDDVLGTASGDVKLSVQREAKTVELKLVLGAPQ
jgi:S1-C subfamily serine protease